MTILFILFFASLIGIGALLWMNTSQFNQLIPAISVEQFKVISLGYIIIGFVFIFLTSSLTYSLIGLSLAGIYAAGTALFLGFKQK